MYYYKTDKNQLLKSNMKSTSNKLLTEITEKEYNAILESKRSKPNEDDLLRIKRSRLFNAFDIYKSNVTYGTIAETEKEHNTIVEWYNSCLELKASAINNPPAQITRYL